MKKVFSSKIQNVPLEIISGNDVLISFLLRFLPWEVSSILQYDLFVGRSVSLPSELLGFLFYGLSWSLKDNTCLGWREESFSPPFLCASDTSSSAFRSGVFYFILIFYPWALVSIGCQYNTRSYSSAFFFSLGIHSSFLSSRITHFLSLWTLTWSHSSYN